jgi:hypothetical protein
MHPMGCRKPQSSTSEWIVRYPRKLLDAYTVEEILCKNKNSTVYRFIEKHIYVGDYVVLCRSS